MEHWIHYYNEGISAKDALQFEQSLAFHLKVLELEPNLEMPEAWHNAGAAYLRLGKRSEGLPYLRKAIEFYDLLIHAIQEVGVLRSNDLASDYLYNDDSDEDEDDSSSERWYSTHDEASEELDDDEFYGDEPVAYYLFWKACCYSLLNERELMLATLTDAVMEDDWYALEALTEEDLQAYWEDADLRKLIDPIILQINSPEHKHLFEIFERIEKRVLIGFEDPIEFVEDVIDEVEAEKWGDPTPITWIRKTVRDLHEKHLEKSKSWPKKTDVIRLAHAFNDLCKDGVLALHYSGHSQIEAIDEVKEVMDDMVLSPDLVKGFCFYSGENVEELIYQEKGTLYLTFNSILLDDPQFGIDIGLIIVKRLKEHGFTVKWDETMKTRIEICDFSWKKVFLNDGDQQLWDHWRVFDLF